MSKIIDRLFSAITKKGHVCLGLDTDLSYLPSGFAADFSGPGEAIYYFNKRIIDATLDVAAVYTRIKTLRSNSLLGFQRSSSYT